MTTTIAPQRLWALVLAGGDGTRLQSLTRQLTGAPIPKQYCRILGDRSLLEATLDRIAPIVPASRTLAIINQAHLALASPQLVALPDANVLVQAANRDTGPGMLVSLRELGRRDPDAVVAVFPSDHDIRDVRAFRRCVAEMVSAVARHPQRIALLGIRPDRIDTGLGYIAPGARLAVPGKAFGVRTFHEKPSRELASRLVRRGGLWNSFVMVGRVARFLTLSAAVEPQREEWNFSRDFLQRIPQHLIVTRGEHLGWSDWGTPEAVERTFAALDLVPPWTVAATA